MLTREDVIRIAEQTGCGWIMNGTQPALFGEKNIKRFADAVFAASAEYERNRFSQEVKAYGRI